MSFYILKIALTVAFVVAISEISQRSSFTGAILASIPVISVLAMLWLYIDTKDVVKVADLSSSVFWLVLPSLALFIVLTVLLKNGINFYLSLSASIGITVGCYFLLIFIAKNLVLICKRPYQCGCYVIFMLIELGHSVVDTFRTDAVYPAFVSSNLQAT